MPEESTPSHHQQVVELAKRRGFFFPANEPYGGVAGFWTYGPRGATLKHNIESRWRERFAIGEGHMEIDSPTIFPEPVFEASGHLRDFTDMIAECPACGRAHRADHLVEATGEVADAEGLSITAIEALMDDLDVHCPDCGNSLADVAVEEFNLMFKTAIGPGSGETGYLRPETAQGIFVDFNRLAEYARNQLPFGVTQIGRGYRNEISPRRAIIRVRELTMAELEFFIDPERDEPDFSQVDDGQVVLYPVAAQEGDREHRHLDVVTAVDEGIITNAWVGYFIGITHTWLTDLGVDPERLRFRQHLPGERAHYARDCWDAEVYLGSDWTELAGLADRGVYDLTKHAEATGEEYTVFRAYDEPKTVERAMVDPDMATLGPEFGERATAIADELERLAATDPDAFDTDTAVVVEVGGDTLEVPVEATGFSIETVTEAGEGVRPEVVEPSFGVDRLVYTVLEHSYHEDEIDGEERRYLALPPSIAPTLAGVFPLLRSDDLSERARMIERHLADAGLSVAYDETGNIGRRYRRQDEIGTPFCITVDHQTLEDDTVTLRERDSTEQIRLDTDSLAAILRDLRDGRSTFEDVRGDADSVMRGVDG